MKTREEIRDWILENCVDSDGDVDLMELDFGDKKVYFSGTKAREIFNVRQKATIRIDNEGQEADEIYNNKQRGISVHNYSQVAEISINNNYQITYDISNKEQKANKIHN